MSDAYFQCPFLKSKLKGGTWALRGSEHGCWGSSQGGPGAEKIISTSGHFSWKLYYYLSFLYLLSHFWGKGSTGNVTRNTCTQKRRSQRKPHRGRQVKGQIHQIQIKFHEVRKKSWTTPELWHLLHSRVREHIAFGGTLAPWGRRPELQW